MTFRMLGDFWLIAEMVLLPLVIVSYLWVVKRHLRFERGGLMEAITIAIAIMLIGRVGFVVVVAIADQIGTFGDFGAITTARGLRVLPLLFAALPVLGSRGRRWLLWGVSIAMVATFVAALGLVLN